MNSPASAPLLARPFVLAALAALAAVAAPDVALAQGAAPIVEDAAPPAQEPRSPPPTDVEEAQDVQVRGRAPPPSRGASDFNVRVGELARVPRQNAAELLKLAPGVLLTNDGGEGHAEQVFLRGFDAREGQDLELTLGGVPINDAGNLHGNGYADTHFIIPELVDSLRVVEGPFDPRQGNFAVAGSAGYELGLHRRGLTAKLTTGSFATRRVLLMWGPEGQSARTFGGAELGDTAGFGENRGARRGSAMGQYEGKLGKDGSYRVGLQAYSTQYNSAGVVRADDVAAGRMPFDGTYDAQQGGDASRYSAWGDLDTRAGDVVLGQQVFVILRDMRLRENFTGLLLDTQRPEQSPHAQRGDLLDLHHDATTFGGRGSARFKKEALGRAQELELGYFARADRSAGTQHRVEARTNVAYLKETDLDARLGDLGLYGDASLRPLGWLTLRGGVRGDLFTYDVLDACAQKRARQPSITNPPGDASCLSQQDLGRYREPSDRRSTSSIAVMPRGSLLFGAFEGFTMSVSYGRGARSIDPVYVNQDLETPFAQVDAYEGGVTWARGFGDVELTARSVFFQTHVDRDLLFSETAGRSTLANGTTRTGWVGALRATGTWFDEAANLTLVRSTFDDTHLLVPYVPDAVLRSDTVVRRELPWKAWGDRVTGALSAGVSYVGRRALPYGQRSDEILTLDGAAAVAWRSYELGLLATNLTDRRYRLSELEYVSDFRGQGQPTLAPARHFSAGAPRGLFLTLTATLGGV